MSIFKSGLTLSFLAAKHLNVILTQLYETCRITQSFRNVPCGLNSFSNEINPSEIINFFLLVGLSTVCAITTPATLVVHLTLVETFAIITLCWLSTHSWGRFLIHHGGSPPIELCVHSWTCLWPDGSCAKSGASRHRPVCSRADRIAATYRISPLYESLMACLMRLHIVCGLFSKSVCIIELVLLLFVILSHIFVEISKFSVVFFLFLSHVEHFFVEFGIDDS